MQFSSRAPYAAVIGPSPAAGIATPLAAQGQAPDERPLLGEVEAPADVTVVTRAEILRYGWLTLADVVRGVRSFLVTNARNCDTSYTRYFYATDSTRYWAVYAQAEWQIAPGWDATIGVRHDHYSSFGGVTDPRLALIWRPNADLTLKAIYGQAFKAPNDYELFYDDGGVSQKANPALAPERIRTSEMLAEWRFAPQSRAVGAYYFNRITDLIATVTDPRDGLLVNVNEQSVIGRGLEAEIEGHTSFGLEVFGASLADPGGPEHRQDRIPQPGLQFWLKVDFAFR